jgi:hypothetical protein
MTTPCPGPAESPKGLGRARVLQGLLSPDVREGLKRGLLIGAAAAVVLLPPGRFATAYSPPGTSPYPMPMAVATPQAAPRLADFGEVEPPADVRFLADWVADARDNGPMDFVVLDKRQAHVYVFDREGRLRADTPVLLGAAVGDDTVEGVGLKPLHDVLPEERTTPAGRFIGESGRNDNGEEVFWVDYDAAVSMHRVRQLEASERRHERLASPTADDNRISYGCINMPVAFFETVMLPTFQGRRGVVYVLPETRELASVFPAAYSVSARHGLLGADDSTTALKR